MGPVERRVRRAINPFSTALTGWWCGLGRRHYPRIQAPASCGTGAPYRVAEFGVRSPAGITVPAGRRPVWEWVPDGGVRPLLDAMPWWVRAWYRTPFLDRYAYSWMWWHGGWCVLPPTAPPPPPPASGVREPRRPTPTPRSGRGMLDETTGAPIG